MALSDTQIITRIKDGSVVISPFNKDQLNTSSYDLTLGEWFYREQQPDPKQHFYNPYNKSHTDRTWGTAIRAERASKVFDEYDFDWYAEGISPDDRIILIRPGETILGHTIEFIGGKHNVTTQMQARSSIGRNFIEVCKCAGWGDIGYINRWTMEITNNSQFAVIPLVVGRRIAQMVFYETGPIADLDYSRNGKYSPSDNLATLKKLWKPEMMLPKMYNDREVQAFRNEFKKGH